LVIALVACAPQIAGPAERQREIDRSDGERLAAQLAQLPGAVRAEVTLHRPTADPFTHGATPASAAVLVVVDAQADRAAIARSSTMLVRGTAPEIAEAAIAVEVARAPVVASQPRPRLVPIAFAAIALLGGWLAWRERWRIQSASRRHRRP
jgi:type III secretory pathway lipoprotein EscJ